MTRVAATVREAIDELRSGRSGTVPCRCPAHDDGRASLSVSRGSDDKILMHCHAGCSLESILAAAGLTTSDLFAESTRVTDDTWTPAGPAVAVYDYRDANGALLFQVCRTADKQFRQRRPDPTRPSGWAWNLDGTRRVLYRLPAVMRAVAAGETLYIAEGEKDVHTLESAGLAATCNPGGAGKFRDEYTAALKGAASVVIVADRDEPGMRHARQIAAALAPVVGHVHIVEAAAGKDAADHFAAGLGVEALVPVTLESDAAPAPVPPVTLAPVTHRRCTGVGNAERFAAQHRGDVHYIHAFARWVQWDGTRFAPDDMGAMITRAKATARGIYAEALAADDPDVRKALSQHGNKTASDRGLREMLALAASEEGVPKRPADFDADPWLFNVRNGTIDLKTGRLRPHNRADLITKCADVSYDHRATCPTWTSFLDRVLADPDLVAFLQRAIGYSLTGLTVEQVLFLLYGSGQNGKSTLLELLRSLLGDYAMQADAGLFLERKNQSGPRNDIARLQGARFVGAVETAEGQRLAEPLVKSLTGSDMITARFLHAEFFEFKPQAKFWLGTNHRPAVRGTDFAIWRRIRLVPFTETIPAEERDPELPAKLRSELSGILRWAIEGCLQWQQDGLRAPAVVLAATETYRTEMDVLGGFLDECCFLDPVDSTETGALYRAYTAWCERTGERASSQRAFGLRLQERGFEPIRGTGGVRRWRGLSLAPDHEPRGSDARDTRDASRGIGPGMPGWNREPSDASRVESDAKESLLGFSLNTVSREGNSKTGSQASLSVTDHSNGHTNGKNLRKKPAGITVPDTDAPQAADVVENDTQSRLLGAGGHVHLRQVGDLLRVETLHGGLVAEVVGLIEDATVRAELAAKVTASCRIAGPSRREDLERVFRRLDAALATAAGAP